MTTPRILGTLLKEFPWDPTRRPVDLPEQALLVHVLRSIAPPSGAFQADYQRTEDLQALADGGTSRIPTIVVEMGTRRYSDLFLFDCDPPGRSAKEKLQILEQDAILLDPQLSCSRCDTDVEIEDFISLSCLDRFYQQHPDYRPEKELIKYKLPIGRRLVVEGIHKEVLIHWLEANAEFADVENMFYLLCEMRQRFSLRNPLSPKEMSDWKRRLQVDLDTTKHVGNRPSHWSP